MLRCKGRETGLRPALRVTNATHSGPAGAITYKFELARDSAFTSMIDSGTQPEGINETGFIPSSDVPSATPLVLEGDGPGCRQLGQ